MSKPHTCIVEERECDCGDPSAMVVCVDTGRDAECCTSGLLSIETCIEDALYSLADDSKCGCTHLIAGHDAGAEVDHG